MERWRVHFRGGDYKTRFSLLVEWWIILSTAVLWSVLGLWIFGSHRHSLHPSCYLLESDGSGVPSWIYIVTKGKNYKEPCRINNDSECNIQLARVPLNWFHFDIKGELYRVWGRLNLDWLYASFLFVFNYHGCHCLSSIAVAVHVWDVIHFSAKLSNQWPIRPRSDPPNSWFASLLLEASVSPPGLSNTGLNGVNGLSVIG